MRRASGCAWVLLVMIFISGISIGSAATLTVTVPRANVRTGPGVTYRVLVNVPRGATFPLVATQESWYQIRLDDGREGWISSSIVRLSQAERGLRIAEPAAPAGASRGLALVIGNAAYPKAPLRNPVNDAKAMATSLTELGFEVTRLLDVPQREMEAAIRQFGTRLRRGGVGLFYFAGHGIQVGGQNFLIPIDAQLHDASDLKYEAVHLGRLLDAVDDAENGLNIVILDACRNNPFARGWRRVRGGAARGLAVVQAAQGTLLAYATSPGAVAEDGVGENGLYTQHLLQQMQVPGQRVEQMFKQVRVNVMKASGGQQIPWESSSLTGDFSFKKAVVAPERTEVPQPPPPSPEGPAVAPGSPDPEAETWAMLKASTYPEDFEAFLEAYPSGRYVVAARLKLQQLKRQQKREAQRREAARQREAEQRQAEQKARQRKAEKQRLAQERAKLEKERQQLAEQRRRESAKAKDQNQSNKRKNVTASKPKSRPSPQKKTVVARREPTPAAPDKPSGRFISYHNGTVLDTQTNLMWMAQDFYNVNKRLVSNWSEAEAWAAKMNRERYGGHQDWRIPTIAEYKTVFTRDKQRRSHKEKRVGYPKAFRDGGGRWFWSSQTSVDDISTSTVPSAGARRFALVLDYARGAVSEEDQADSFFSVRLVRSVR